MIIASILVVDDSAFVFKMIKKALEPHGYEMVGYAEDGVDGVKLYEELRPDIVIMDLTMPIMNGVVCARKIYKINPEAKIVMLSAIGEGEVIEDSKEIGVRYFLTKPLNSEKMLEVLKKMME